MVIILRTPDPGDDTLFAADEGGADNTSTGDDMMPRKSVDAEGIYIYIYIYNCHSIVSSFALCCLSVPSYLLAVHIPHHLSQEILSIFFIYIFIFSIIINRRKEMVRCPFE